MKYMPTKYRKRVIAAYTEYLDALCDGDLTKAAKAKEGYLAAVREAGEQKYGNANISKNANKTPPS